MGYQELFMISQDADVLLFMRRDSLGITYVEHQFKTPFFTERYSELTVVEYEFELAKARLWYTKVN